MPSNLLTGRASWYMQEVTQDPPEQHAQTLQHKQNGSGPSSKPSQPDSSPLRQLQPITELALSAIQSRRNLFTLPEAGIPTGGASPVPPGEPSRLYYDRAGVGVGGGALPQGAQPVLKAGINNWEVIRLLDMQKAEALEATEGEWWSVDINLTEVSRRWVSLESLSAQSNCQHFEASTN